MIAAGPFLDLLVVAEFSKSFSFLSAPASRCMICVLPKQANPNILLAERVYLQNGKGSIQPVIAFPFPIVRFLQPQLNKAGFNVHPFLPHLGSSGLHLASEQCLLISQGSEANP